MVLYRPKIIRMILVDRRLHKRLPDTDLQRVIYGGDLGKVFCRRSSKSLVTYIKKPRKGLLPSIEDPVRDFYFFRWHWLQDTCYRSSGCRKIVQVFWPQKCGRRSYAPEISDTAVLTPRIAGRDILAVRKASRCLRVPQSRCSGFGRTATVLLASRRVGRSLFWPQNTWRRSLASEYRIQLFWAPEELLEVS